jgi:hypothetical protein
MISDRKFVTIPRETHSWLPPAQPVEGIDYAAEAGKIEAAATAAGLDVVYGESLFDSDGRDPAKEINWMPFWSHGGYEWDTARWEAHFRAEALEPLPVPV